MSRHRHAAVGALVALAGVGRAVAARSPGSLRDTTLSAQNGTTATAQNATTETAQSATTTATTATGTPSVEGLSTAAAEAQTAAAPALEFGTPIAPGVAGLAAGVGLGLVVATAVVYWGVGE